MFKNKLWLVLLSIATSIILLVLSIVNILQLCEVGTFRAYNRPLNICSIIVSYLIIILLNFTVFGSAYKVTKKGLLCNIGIIFYSIPYDKVLLARTDASKSILILYIQTTDKDADVIDKEADLMAKILPININPNQIEKFVDCIKIENPQIIYEISEIEIQKKKDKKEQK